MATTDFRVIFMGTPEFAVASLKALLDAGIHVVAIVTASDKPAGRGQVIRESEVKMFAANLHIPVLTPQKLKDESFIEALRSFGADLNVVVAFRMLPEVVWAMPRYGTINLHASLLPQYRGAAPINWVIINGETKTGVTTFFIDKEIDTGKIILSKEVEITPEDNAGTLHDKLMLIGAEVLVSTVLAIRDNKFSTISQSAGAGHVTVKTAPKLSREGCRIDWSDDMDKIADFVRGLSPYPAAWGVLVNHENDWRATVKIYETQKERTAHPFPPGTILTDEKKFVKVAVNGGFLDLKTVQLEGKKRLGIGDFLRGFKQIGRFRLE